MWLWQLLFPLCNFLICSRRARFSSHFCKLHWRTRVYHHVASCGGAPRAGIRTCTMHERVPVGEHVLHTGAFLRLDIRFVNHRWEPVVFTDPQCGHSFKVEVKVENTKGADSLQRPGISRKQSESTVVSLLWLLWPHQRGFLLRITAGSSWCMHPCGDRSALVVITLKCTVCFLTCVSVFCGFRSGGYCQCWFSKENKPSFRLWWAWFELRHFNRKNYRTHGNTGLY